MEKSLQTLSRTDNSPQSVNLSIMQEDKPLKILETIVKAGALTSLEIAKIGHQYLRIREYNREEVRIQEAFGYLFAHIATLVGLKGEIDPIQKQEIWNAVFEKFAGLSFQEIYKAFQMDRRGDFGEITNPYQFFDSSYVCTVLGKYRQWLQDTQREHNINISQLPEKQNTMTEEETEASVISWLTGHFEEYKQTKKLPILSVPVYDALYRRGILQPYFATLTEEDKQLMRAETEKRLRQEQTKAKDKKEFSAIKALIEQYQKGVNDTEGRLRSFKEENTLKFFYNYLISQGKELSELLTHKEQ
ncbi:Uncharacterised protein [Capnocytophaga ochracea]|uniref:Uncharacterized protein n=2 Tax=Capnocytophaga ochracea TaxID=1018 RepID=A0A2X2UT37_CAPOC|nr:Uncharacterised protein [Capnocytophaga ochracea]